MPSQVSSLVIILGLFWYCMLSHKDAHTTLAFASIIQRELLFSGFSVCSFVRFK